MANDVNDRLRREVAERAYHVCEYCLVHENDTFWGCQIDHIISRKHDGLSESSNLAWACSVCNSNKGTDLGALAGLRQRLHRLFHPRKDRWLSCFALERVRIDPLNVIGESTVRLLKLNDPARLRERQTMTEIGRYPTVEALARMRD